MTTEPRRRQINEALAWAGDDRTVHAQGFQTAVMRDHKAQDLAAVIIVMGTRKGVVSEYQPIALSLRMLDALIVQLTEARAMMDGDG